MPFYKLPSHIVLRKEEFGALVFDRRSWNVHQLNQTGQEILELLSKQYSSSELIHRHFDSMYGELSQEQSLSIDEFVKYLLSLGIIETTDKYVCLEDTDKIYGDNLTISSSTRLARYLSAPLFVWWDITALCNLKCKQCYSSSGKPLPDEMVLSEVQNVLLDLARAKVFYIYFLGGEPFARKDFLKILESCQTLGLEVMISTNGWFVTDEIAHQLVRLGVRHVRVSIDGATEQTHDMIRGVPGSFQRAIQAVRTLKQAGIPVVGITPTMMSENIHEANALIDLAYSLGVDEIQLVQVCAVGRGRELSTLSLEQVLELKSVISSRSQEMGKELFISSSEGVWEKPYSRCVMEGKIFPGVMGCGAGRTCLAIGPTGKVRACLLFQHEVGDLKAASFRQIWAGENYPELQWLRSVKEGCDDCKYAEICSGPCPMQQIIPSEQRKCFSQLDQHEGESTDAKLCCATN